MMHFESPQTSHWPGSAYVTSPNAPQREADIKSNTHYQHVPFSSLPLSPQQTERHQGSSVKPNAPSGTAPSGGVEVVYDRVVPILCVWRQRESAICELTVKMSLITPDHSSAPSVQRVLHMTLTDESDPFFMFVTDIGESDFQLIKREHALHIDFMGLYVHLAEYLERCLGSHGQNPPPMFAELRVNGGDKGTSILSFMQVRRRSTKPPHCHHNPQSRSVCFIILHVCSCSV
jgi:hypothetical protein